MSEHKQTDIRFALLNIQGLQTKRLDKLISPELTNIFNNNDIICLTETWGSDVIDFSVNGFIHYNVNRNEMTKNTTRRSGGVIIYIREKFVKDDTFILNYNDSHIWIKLEGQFFNLENDLYMCVCYIVPDNSGRNAFIDSNIYDVFLDNMIYINNLTNGNCNYMYLGDFNSRIGNLCDFVTSENISHMENLLPDDYSIDTELPRQTKDKIVNSNGHFLIDFLKESGLRIVNGRVCGDEGSFTFIGSRGSSLIDYCIVNPELLNSFTSFYVHAPNILSDHCLMEFTI